MQVDIKVVQLLSSRLCHDLIGPTGAIHNGMELYEEMGGDGGGDALKMVSISVAQLSARLGFFRMAFGLGGLSGRQSAISEARQLAVGFLEGGRIKLDWPLDGEAEPSIPVIKMLLNVILVAVDALPRGGTLSVSLTDRGGAAIGVSVKAVGESARLKEDLRRALFPVGAAGGEPDLNAHNIHGFFCHQLVHGLAAELDVSETENEVLFVVLVQG